MFHVWAIEVDPWVKALAMQACRPEFNPWSSHRRRRREKGHSMVLLPPLELTPAHAIIIINIFKGSSVRL